MQKIYKIDSSIYDNKVIIDGISAFSDIANIKYNNNLLEIFGETDSEIEEVFNEFMNYCIHLINEN